MPDWAISSGMWNAIFGNDNSLTGGLGGTFAIRRKVPPLEEVQHQEVVRRLSDLTGKLDLLLQQKSGPV
jgi:hypothetical protein